MVGLPAVMPMPDTMYKRTDNIAVLKCMGRKQLQTKPRVGIKRQNAILRNCNIAQSLIIPVMAGNDLPESLVIMSDIDTAILAHIQRVYPP